MLPDFSAFLAQLDPAEVDRLAKRSLPGPPLTLSVDLDDPQGLQTALQLALDRVQDHANAKALALLSAYHAWLQKQLAPD